MMWAARLLPGTVVSGVVVASSSWGLRIRIPGHDLDGFVDQGLVADETPSLDARVWPDVGATVTALVHRYTSDGQLRLTLRPSDLAWAEGRDPSSNFWQGRSAKS